MNHAVILQARSAAGGAQADTRRTEYHFDGTDFATYANGKHQLRFGIDIPGICRRGLGNAPVLADGNYVRPNLDLGQNRDMQSEGYLTGNALELTFRGKPSKYYSGQIQYTLSRTYNNSSGIAFFPESSYDAAADWDPPTTTACTNSTFWLRLSDTILHAGHGPLALFGQAGQHHYRRRLR